MSPEIAAMLRAERAIAAVADPDARRRIVVYLVARFANGATIDEAIAKHTERERPSGHVVHLPDAALRSETRTVVAKIPCATCGHYDEFHPQAGPCAAPQGCRCRAFIPAATTSDPPENGA